MANWNRNTVPKCKEKECSDEVLVTVDNGRFKRVLKAVFIPYHHCTVEDMGWNTYDKNRQFGQRTILRSNKFPNFCPNCGKKLS